MPGTNKTFATRLRVLREKNGLSQSALADKLGISRGSISFYENGERTPGINVLLALCAFFRVSTSYMTGADDGSEFSLMETQKRSCMPPDDLAEPIDIGANIAAGIKKARLMAGLSQKKVAGELGKAQTTVTAWETGRAQPDAGTIVRLALLFRVSTDYLLGLPEPDMECRSDGLTVGDRIRVARKDAGLTQQELGDMLGVSSAMIGQYEIGMRNPKPETISRFAAALKVDPRELYSGARRSCRGISAKSFVLDEQEVEIFKKTAEIFERLFNE